MIEEDRVATDGEALYGLVEEYTGFGDHRTGTTVDDETREWFADELAARGAAVDESAYEFVRFEGATQVTGGGRVLPSMPLWYSAEGIVDVDGLGVEPLEMLAGVWALDLDDRIAASAALGAPAVVLTTGDRLVAHNREPMAPTPGPPVVLVGLDGADPGPVAVSFAGLLEAARSATVLGRLGDGAPVVVTTPLTGWFRCAGERGTGIAIALELAARLAERARVLVVGTTGHELGGLGVRDALGRLGDRPGAVIHLGASLAAADRGDDGALELSMLRRALVDADGPTRARVGEALEPAHLPVAPEGADWSAGGGEGAMWRGPDVAVLSVQGSFGRFHSPDDLPDEVTTPDLLARVGDALVAAAHRLLDVTT